MKIRATLCVSLLAFGMTTLAHADGIQAIAWSVPASTADTVPPPGPGIPGPGAVEWATFTANTIDFNVNGNYTLGSFLTSNGNANNISYMNSAGAGTSMDNVLFQFTGTANFVNGTTYTLADDDGVNLYVDGEQIYSSPGTQGASTQTLTYNGPTGTFSFDFTYANGPCCGAQFTTNLVNGGNLVNPPTVPEPSSILLLGSGLLTTAGFLRRRLA